MSSSGLRCGRRPVRTPVGTAVRTPVRTHVGAHGRTPVGAPACVHGCTHMQTQPLGPARQRAGSRLPATKNGTAPARRTGAVRSSHTEKVRQVVHQASGLAIRRFVALDAGRRRSADRVAKLDQLAREMRPLA